MRKLQQITAVALMAIGIVASGPAAMADLLPPVPPLLNVNICGPGTPCHDTLEGLLAEADGVVAAIEDCIALNPNPCDRFLDIVRQEAAAVVAAANKCTSEQNAVCATALEEAKSLVANTETALTKCVNMTPGTLCPATIKLIQSEVRAVEALANDCLANGLCATVVSTVQTEAQVAEELADAVAAAMLACASEAADAATGTAGRDPLGCGSDVETVLSLAQTAEAIVLQCANGSNATCQTVVALVDTAAQGALLCAGSVASPDAASDPFTCSDVVRFLKAMVAATKQLIDDCQGNPTTQCTSDVETTANEVKNCVAGDVVGTQAAAAEDLQKLINCVEDALTGGSGGGGGGGCQDSSSGSLPGSIQHAPPGKKGLDVDSVISSSQAQQYAASGYTYAIRYISRESTEQSGDLKAPEAKDILNSGLALMPVQHVENPGWRPSGSLGTQYGDHAAANSKSIGFPDCVNIWLDLEGVSTSAPDQDVIDYCNNWSKAVSSRGYTPGIYVGPNSGLSGDQLANLRFSHYWKSMSTVPPIPGRGYQMIQSPGNGVDDDKTQNDQHGGSVLWLKK